MRGRRSLTRRFLQTIFAGKYRQEVDYGKPLAELFREGEFGNVHPGITEESFPPEEWEIGKRVVEFWPFWNPELDESYFPASLRDLLAYCKAYPIHVGLFFYPSTPLRLRSGQVKISNTTLVIFYAIACFLTRVIISSLRSSQ